ncbi:MAG TPA: ABC transporter ATP-binding protein [Candidatus Gastranaerophilales bacterium]|nr:ABC transporter ATP-binding protein [Candidatus Gastranaerophilales bacterium]
MQKILKIKNLDISFNIEGELYKAVHNINISLSKNQVLGIVGESGCGKSVTAMSVLKLLASNAVIESGEILFKGQNLLTLSTKQLQEIRGSKIAFIPQDPLNSLNPLYTAGDQLMETIIFHRHVSKKEAKKLAIEALKDVKIPEAENRLNEYPHQFSGGMCQRVLIAMALSCDPEIIIADEPTTALDVTVQAQILDLIRKIQKERQTSLIFITHDLGVVAEFCDYIAVMYSGRVVEYADVKSIFKNPLHPYTKGLLDSLPSQEKKELNVIKGQPPAITDKTTGCVFHPRCSCRMDICDKIIPEKTEPASEHSVSCHLYN